MRQPASVAATLERTDMSEEDEFELEPIEILELPLDAWHRDKGARMVEFAGYHMPIHYEGIMAEHIWTRDNAGLFDVSHMGQLMLTGDGVAEALEAMVPGDISALKEGKMRYSLLLAEDGGVLDDMMITAVPMGLYVVVNGAVKWDDMGYLREYLPDEVTINTMEDRALLALQGPKAAEALKRVVPGVDALYFMEAGSFFWGPKTDPEPLWISRSGYTGEDGFEISIPSAHVAEFAELLCRALNQQQQRPKLRRPSSLQQNLRRPRDPQRAAAPRWQRSPAPQSQSPRPRRRRNQLQWQRAARLAERLLEPPLTKTPAAGARGK
jgi:folate-binding Fe-S cluster repair protein YgfZ